MQATTGTLYLCATPIGNLEDITLRVLRILQEVDEIWAEDTRRTLTLLNHLGIKKPLKSCHEHNEAVRAELLRELITNGKSIAYCSDAGMPGISDPGALLVQYCIKENLPVTILPGASAVLMSAVLSGLVASEFCFYGFIPRKGKERSRAIKKIAEASGQIIIYESPLRVNDTLRDLYGVLGERRAAVLRELTKLHEECVRGNLSELMAIPVPRGECIIAIEGKPEAEEYPADEAMIDNALASLLGAGFSTKDAAAAVSAIFSVQKKRAYERALLVVKK